MPKTMFIVFMISVFLISGLASAQGQWDTSVTTFFFSSITGVDGVVGQIVTERPLEDTAIEDILVKSDIKGWPLVANIGYTVGALKLGISYLGNTKGKGSYSKILPGYVDDGYSGSVDFFGTH